MTCLPIATRRCHLFKPGRAVANVPAALATGTSQSLWPLHRAARLSLTESIKPFGVHVAALERFRCRPHQEAGMRARAASASVRAASLPIVLSLLRGPARQKGAAQAIDRGHKAREHAWP